MSIYAGPLEPNATDKEQILLVKIAKMLAGDPDTDDQRQVLLLKIAQSLLALLNADSGGSGEGDAATLNGQSGAYYRARVNHIGTQTLSTISDAGTMAGQNANSVTITGGTAALSTLFVNGVEVTGGGGSIDQSSFDALLGSSNGAASGITSVNASTLGGLSAAQFLVPGDIGSTVQGYNSSTTLQGNTTTGSGAIVLNDTPILITPLLGTPTSGVLTNCTGTASGLTAGSVTTNANLTGDVTSSGNATTVGKLNGVSLAGLATGILKNTTATGAPSIAVAADFPTLNQNTSGSAATWTTGRTLSLTGDVTYTSPSINGSGNVTAAATIANSAVTLAKMADMATASLLGRSTAGIGAPEVLSTATAKSLLSLNLVENTALSTWAGSANLITAGAFTSGSTGAGFTIALSVATVTGTLAAARGGTGVSNTGTITLGASLTTTGTSATTLAFPSSGTPTYTLPAASQTLASLAGTETLTNHTLGSGTVITAATMTLGSDAAGDIYYRASGGLLTRLAVGSDTNVLTLASGLPSWAAPSGGAAVANPGAQVLGLTAINGVAATAMRSDGAPALNQAIAPTWTATHTFSQPAIATTATNAVIQANVTAATSGVAVQYAPSRLLTGTAWNTTATAATNYLEMLETLRPVSAAIPTSTLAWAFRRSTAQTGAYTDAMTLTSGGNLTIANSFTATASGTFGTSAIATNNIVIGAGAGILYFSGRSTVTSDADGRITLANNAVTSLSRLNFGGNTDSFAGLQISGTAITAGLAGGGAGGSLTASGTLAVTSTSTFTGAVTLTGGIVGVTTNSNATALNVGEHSNSLIPSGSAVSLTNATAANVTSISLTAGDWDVSGNISYTMGTATVTGKSGGISSTSATIPTDGTEINNGSQFTLISSTDGIAIPRKRFSLSGTTTVYMSTSVSFSAGTVSAYGAMTARRVR